MPTYGDVFRPMVDACGALVFDALRNFTTNPYGDAWPLCQKYAPQFVASRFCDDFSRAVYAYCASEFVASGHDAIDNDCRDVLDAWRQYEKVCLSRIEATIVTEYALTY